METNKPTLILLHGALGSGKQLVSIKEQLTGNYNLIVPDLSGHGGRPFNPNGFSIDIFVNEVADLMQSEGIEKAHFFGYSMGGYIALKMALTYPRKVDRIFTLGTKFDWTPDTAAHEIKNLDPEKIEEKVPRFAEALRERHAPLNWKDVVKRTAGLMSDLGNGQALSINDFVSLTQSVKIGIGTQDNMVSIDESEKVATALPNGSLHVFEGFKHPIELADTGILGREIAEFLQ